MLEPLKLRPICKDYLWGGVRLKTEFALPTELERVAEGWMLSAHRDGENTVENGELAGRTLTEAVQEQGAALLGARGAAAERFPLLIKLIDAAQDLSVQVHPDNDYAYRVEGEPGKTEMWYVVDAAPGAVLYYGFQRDVTPEELRRRTDDGTLTEVLRAVPVKRGDVLFIDAGTVHAIGAGVFIAEVQQNSNTTYRLYDYGRVGADGKPRELHTEKAAAVAKLARETRATRPEGTPEKLEGCVRTLLKRCEYFTAEHFTVEGMARLAGASDSFSHLLVLSGGAVLRCPGCELPVVKGDSVLLPAALGEYQIEGSCELIRSTL